MTCELVAIAVDALDPEGLARFWSRLLGRELANATVGDGVFTDPDGNEFVLRP